MCLLNHLREREDSMGSGNQKVHISGKMVHESEVAYLVAVKGVEAWIPRSLVGSVVLSGNDILSMEIPQWLAEDRKIDYTEKD